MGKKKVIFHAAELTIAGALLVPLPSYAYCFQVNAAIALTLGRVLPVLGFQRSYFIPLMVRGLNNMLAMLLIAAGIAYARTYFTLTENIQISNGLAAWGSRVFFLQKAADIAIYLMAWLATKLAVIWKPYRHILGSRKLWLDTLTAILMGIILCVVPIIIVRFVVTLWCASAVIGGVMQVPHVHAIYHKHFDEPTLKKRFIAHGLWVLSQTLMTGLFALSLGFFAPKIFEDVLDEVNVFRWQKAVLAAVSSLMAFMFFYIPKFLTRHMKKQWRRFSGSSALSVRSFNHGESRSALMMDEEGESSDEGDSLIKAYSSTKDNDEYADYLYTEHLHLCVHEDDVFDKESYQSVGEYIFLGSGYLKQTLGELTSREKTVVVEELEEAQANVTRIFHEYIVLIGSLQASDDDATCLKTLVDEFVESVSQIEGTCSEACALLCYAQALNARCEENADLLTKIEEAKNTITKRWNFYVHTQENHPPVYCKLDWFDQEEHQKDESLETSGFFSFFSQRLSDCWRNSKASFISIKP